MRLGYLLIILILSVLQMPFYSYAQQSGCGPIIADARVISELRSLPPSTQKAIGAIEAFVQEHEDARICYEMSKEEGQLAFAFNVPETFLEDVALRNKTKEIVIKLVMEQAMHSNHDFTSWFGEFGYFYQLEINH